MWIALKLFLEIASKLKSNSWDVCLTSSSPRLKVKTQNILMATHQYPIILSWNIEWRLTDFSRNQPPINYKRLIDLKITLGKFTYPNSLRTADVLFQAVAFLPPKNNVLFFRGREATTGNTSAVHKLLSQGLHWAFPLCTIYSPVWQGSMNTFM